MARAAVPLDGPIAVWEVTLPAGSLEARLVVLPIRPKQPPAAPAVTVDGRRVPCRVESDSIRFPVEGGGSAGSGWPARGSARAGERRTLGLPVGELSFEPR